MPLIRGGKRSVMDTIVTLIVNSGIFAVLLGLLASVITLAKKQIDARVAEVAANIKDTNIKSAVSTAENCIETVVYETAQTTVDALKSASADGKLTTDDASTIKADAVAKIKQLMSDEVYNSLHTIFGDADAWIESKLEAAVKDLKIKSPAAVLAASDIQTADAAQSAALAQTGAIQPELTAETVGASSAAEAVPTAG